MLGWLVDEKQIEPHVPVWDKSQRADGTFEAGDFMWDEQANEYRCPAGKALRALRRPFKIARTGITKENTIRYRASQFDCASCPLKPRCCPNMRCRQKREVSTSGRAMRLGESLQQKVTGSRGRIVRRSRFSSPTSNAFFGWISYGYVALAGRAMNSY